MGSAMTVTIAPSEREGAAFRFVVDHTNGVPPQRLAICLTSCAAHGCQINCAHHLWGHLSAIPRFCHRRIRIVGHAAARNRVGAKIAVVFAGGGGANPPAWRSARTGVSMTEDAIQKILADPDGLRRLYDEIARQLAEKREAEAAEQAAIRQRAVDTAISAVVRKFSDQIAAVRADIEAIKKRDGDRRYLNALNYAQHQNGRLTFDPEKFRAAWESWGTA
jgi:hypothetical protein